MDFQTTLREHHMKVTPQRLDILHSLYERGHANIDEIHEDLKTDNPSMSLTTIYRNLNEMMKNALVSEIKLPKEKQRYEITKTPHIHLLCTKCKKLIDGSVDLERLIHSVEIKYGCDVLDNDIVLNIVCNDCK